MTGPIQIKPLGAQADRTLPRLRDAGINVFAVADHKKGKAAYITMTLEHNLAFVLSSDTQTKGRYEALIENRP